MYKFLPWIALAAAAGSTSLTSSADDLQQLQTRAGVLQRRELTASNYGSGTAGSSLPSTPLSSAELQRAKEHSWLLRMNSMKDFEDRHATRRQDLTRAIQTRAKIEQKAKMFGVSKVTAHFSKGKTAQQLQYKLDRLNRKHDQAHASKYKTLFDEGEKFNATGDFSHLAPHRREQLQRYWHHKKAYELERARLYEPIWNPQWHNFKRQRLGIPSKPVRVPTDGRTPWGLRRMFGRNGRFASGIQNGRNGKYLIDNLSRRNRKNPLTGRGRRDGKSLLSDPSRRNGQAAADNPMGSQSSAASSDQSTT